ncbi:type II toxin-antitoxin system RelE/ParE family toxin [Methylopila turkensis]|uniref:Type II toxin-antitoxin system RelE/ParE family toxin n=1 Tax=Methylopila turkensis TaxID=1437816 RepID=A0A9W6JP46_9HYPH|nr:type II toxin-antitoxin system RelE/ParE family toxin [Methylopila turkensis]GLK79445.1 hypothetical protein GCM10008174_11860 [Methylopila turkensis]
MKVRLSGDARRFLRHEAGYLRDRNRAAAEKFVVRIGEALSNLAQFSKIGAGAEPSPVAEARRLVVGDYVLIYEISGTSLSVTSIRHGRMSPGSRLVDDDFDYEADDGR